MNEHVELKTFIRTFVLHYFMIYGLTMLMTLLFILVFNREAEFGIDYLWQAALFALAADAPLAVYISPVELTNKQYWIRTVIHAALLEAGLLPIGYVIDMWDGVGGFFAFFFAVLVVDAAMHFLEFLNAKMATDKINKAIRARRLAESNAPESNAPESADDGDGETVTENADTAGGVTDITEDIDGCE